MGANQGRAKGNIQEAEYEEPGKKTRETRWERTGKTKDAKAESGTGKATVRRNREEKERKKQKAE